MKTTKKQSGFTLVELAIVLVIIGLIVGGVLAGQDLIKAAEIRSTLSQMETYDTAVNTFRGKYNALPGDMTTAANFGFDSTNLTSDGDGLIDASADTTGTEYDEEAAMFFRHMSQANLIGDVITGEPDGANTADIDDISLIAPTSKLGRGSRWLVRQTGGTNYFALLAPSATNGVLTITDGSQLPVISAMQLDNKLDDGYPTSGKVIAVTDFDTADAGAAAADDICVNTTPDPDAYNTGTTARQNDTECAIRLRASF